MMGTTNGCGGGAGVYEERAGISGVALRVGGVMEGNSAGVGDGPDQGKYHCQLSSRANDPEYQLHLPGTYKGPTSTTGETAANG